MEERHIKWESLKDRRDRLAREKSKEKAAIDEKESKRKKLYEKIMSDSNGDEEVIISFNIPVYGNSSDEHTISCTKRESNLLENGFIDYIDIKGFRDWLDAEGVLYGGFHHAFIWAELDFDDNYRRLLDYYRKDGNQGALDKIREHIEINEGDDMTRLYADTPLPSSSKFIILCTKAQKKLYELGFIELSEMPIYRDVIRRRYDLEEIRQRRPDLYASLKKYEEEDKERLERKKAKREGEAGKDKSYITITTKEIADASKGLPKGSIDGAHSMVTGLAERPLDEKGNQ